MLISFPSTGKASFRRASALLLFAPLVLAAALFTASAMALLGAPDANRVLPYGVIACVLIGPGVLWVARRDLKRLACAFQDTLARVEESESRFKGLVEATFDGIVIHSDGIILEANTMAERMFGYAPGEMIRLSIYEIAASPAAISQIRRRIETSFDRSYETIVKRKNGSSFPVEVVARDCLYQGKKARIAAIRDLSEKRALESRFRSLFEQAPVPIQFFRLDGFCVDANVAWESLWQASRNVLHDYNILKDPHAEMDPPTWELMGRAFRGESVLIPPTYYDPARIGKTGRTRWIETHLFPLKEADGSIREVAGVLLDVTDREELTGKLREALKVRDEFLSIASHELRTPLTPLAMRLEAAQIKLEEQADGLAPQELRHLLDSSLKQVNKITRLVEELLDISRIRSGRLRFNFVNMDLGSLVEDAVERFREHARHCGCEIETRMDPDVCGRWDPFRIEQVIENLLTNAIKFGSGKPITVEVGRSGGDARFRVQDRGIGIAPENQRRIFERFERISSSNNVAGLGLGLYIAREIVQAHSGQIEVRSEPGAGSVFTVSLPCAQ